MRSLSELTHTDDPAYPLIQEWLAEARNPVTLLPRDAGRAEAELQLCQVSTRSVMGAVVYETGGILIDNGWLRILGSGSERLPRGLGSWNLGRTLSEAGAAAPYLLIADDAAGGYFAVNGGGLAAPPGHVCYLAPDTLEWEDCELAYSDFLYWTFCGDLHMFYQNCRWQGWQDDAARLGGDDTYSFFPFLWTKEGQDINRVERRIVPVAEHYAAMLDIRQQIT
ncbi:hypothetical protein L1281_000245 [Neisseria sp. HSC-16F19]|nr:DUF2625 domain-containing protein [Neisseria sp. HSC-16F19]MCP2039675.1 hypothetical protein [Neisseria sp. HSC-16F19]